MWSIYFSHFVFEQLEQLFQADQLNTKFLDNLLRV